MSLKNYKLTIEYDGSCFAGWQMQPEQKTVQGDLIKALTTYLGSAPEDLHASGRTDAGVHARGQVGNFKTTVTVELIRLSLGLSSLMRNELSVVKAEEVPLDFHARYSAKSKTYCYQIFHRQAAPVLQKGFVWHVPQKLDLALMEKELQALVGKQDFKSLQASDCCAADSIREIYSAQLKRAGDLLFIRVSGDGFLKQMVRTIVGTVIDIASANKTMAGKTLSGILLAKDRSQAGRTAPAHGLYLEEVQYNNASVSFN